MTIQQLRRLIARVRRNYEYDLAHGNRYAAQAGERELVQLTADLAFLKGRK